MLNHAHRRAFVAPFVASVCLFGVSDTWAQSVDDLPPPSEEPWLAEPGDRWAEYNELQIACYQGSMSACDSIWLDERLLLDSLLSKYGRTCGGRADHREISGLSLLCTEAFPGHE
jgi:hypothetical protein